jgi:hypothetical protein
VESPEAAALQADGAAVIQGYSLRNPFRSHCRFDRRAGVTPIGLAARSPILDRPEIAALSKALDVSSPG